MLIHHAPGGYWTGASREIGERDAVPVGWILGPAPPELEDGEVALWCDGWVVVSTPVGPAATIEDRLALLADLRWQKTQTMPTYDGATDVPADTARSVVTSKVLAAQFLTPEEQMAPQQFKLKPGEWRSWAVPDLVAYGMAIGAYMQRCFDHEAVLEAEIRAAEDPSSIDITAGWPT